MKNKKKNNSSPDDFGITVELVDKHTVIDNHTILGSHARQLKHMLKNPILVERIRQAFDNVHFITSKEQLLKEWNLNE